MNDRVYTKEELVQAIKDRDGLLVYKVADIVGSFLASEWYMVGDRLHCNGRHTSNFGSDRDACVKITLAVMEKMEGMLLREMCPICGHDLKSHSGATGRPCDDGRCDECEEEKP